VRPWLFRTFFGEYPSTLTALRIGPVVMLGTPCDFSGELSPAIDSAAAKLGLRSIITSFNGGYIGYITRDEFYDRDHYETQIMNWFGPGNGAYLSEDMIKMMSILSDR
jgi:neutral ceramidase